MQKGNIQKLERIFDPTKKMGRSERIKAVRQFEGMTAPMGRTVFKNEQESLMRL